MDLPSDPLDRIAELEAAVARLEAAAAASRAARDERNRPLNIRLAITAEESDGYYPTQPAGELPIKFVDASCASGCTVATLTDRSAETSTRAISPVGWLPPLCYVEVAEQPKGEHRWRIVRAPVTLVGKAATDIPAADGWVSGAGAYYAGAVCDEYEVGRNTVQIFRKVTGGGLTDDYALQRYSNDDAVTMEWANISEVVTANKLLIATIDPDNQWLVIVEPCGNICADA